MASSQMTCDQCKLSSPLAELFRPVRRAGKRLNLCPACVAEETRRSALGGVIGVGFAVAIGGAVASLGGASNAGWVLLNFALLAMMLWILTIPHEAGHALAARLLGLRVERVVIGVGPLLKTFVLCGVPVDIHALPLGGLTYPEVRDEPTARMKRVVVIAAGPLVELLLLWAALRFGGDIALAEQWSQGLAPTTAFIVACILGLIANVLPMRASTHAGVMGNDGAQLLWLLFSRRIPVREMAWAGAVQRAQMLIVHGQDAEAERFARSALEKHPDDAYLLLALSAAILNQHRFGEGRALLVPLLARPGLPGKVSAVASNNLAWANLNLGGPALIAEARTLSAAAYHMLPWEPYTASSYACAEALYGDADAALAAAQRALAAPRTFRKRAPAYAALAVVHARRRRFEEAAAALAAAEALDPSCPLLHTVRERISHERAASCEPAPRSVGRRTHRAGNRRTWPDRRAPPPALVPDGRASTDRRSARAGRPPHAHRPGTELRTASR
jgi:tetratricopeptide (TPR) repeat protein